MLKFITADGQTIGQKRKQSQRACEPCRRRKRRCNHATALETTPSLLPRSSASKSSMPAAALTMVTDGPQSSSSDHRSGSDAQEVHENLRAKSYENSSNSRLSENVTASGDSNSAGSLVRCPHDNDQNADRQGLEILGSRFIGDLNPEGIFLAAISNDTTRGASSKDSIGTWLASKLCQTADQFGSAEQSDQPRSGLFYGSASLVNKVLLPLLQEECLSLLPPTRDAEALCSFYFDYIHTIIPVLDEQGFRSLSLTDPARSLLLQGMCLAASMNPSSKQHLSLPDAGSVMSHREFGKRIFAAMRMSVEIGLVTKKIVLIQALALMSLFIDGPDGGDISLQICGRAVQYVHSLGLHIQGRCRDQADQYAVTLLCCIWALDRLNAAIHGRPVLMHERDIGRDLVICFEQQEPCLRLLLRVTMLLDQVIELYRPNANPGIPSWEGEFPSFEDLLLGSAGLHVPTRLLATIETLYHAVAILSCRSRSWETPSRSSASYVRQNLSASRVTSMVGQEFRGQIILLPFVPYAVSLSLSIAYRDLRHSKIPMYRARARNNLHTNCKVLEELGEMFWTASRMAEMGKATIREMDRVYSTVTEIQQRKNRKEGGNETMNDINENQSIQSPPAPGSDELLQPDMHWPEVGGRTAANIAPPLQEVDLSPFNGMPDLDLFGLFDPNFDLDGIDACLEGNLDLSFPTNLY